MQNSVILILLLFGYKCSNFDTCSLSDFKTSNFDIIMKDFSIKDHNKPEFECLNNICAHYLRKIFNNAFIDEHNLHINLVKEKIVLEFLIQNKKYNKGLPDYVFQFANKSNELIKLRKFLEGNEFLDIEDDYELCLFESIRIMQIFCENNIDKKGIMIFNKSEMIAFNCIIRILTKHTFDFPFCYAKLILIKEKGTDYKKFTCTLGYDFKKDCIQYCTGIQKKIFKFFNLELLNILYKSYNETYEYLIKSSHFKLLIKNKNKKFDDFFMACYTLWRVLQNKKNIINWRSWYNYKFFDTETFDFEKNINFFTLFNDENISNFIGSTVSLNCVKENTRFNFSKFIKKRFKKDKTNFKKHEEPLNGQHKIKTESNANATSEKNFDNNKNFYDIVIDLNLEAFIYYQKYNMDENYFANFFKFLSLEQIKLEIEHDILHYEYKIIVNTFYTNKNDYEGYKTQVLDYLKSLHDNFKHILQNFDDKIAKKLENISDQIRTFLNNDNFDSKKKFLLKKNFEDILSLLNREDNMITTNITDLIFLQINQFNKFFKIFNPVKELYVQRKKQLKKYDKFIRLNSEYTIIWQKFLNFIYNEISLITLVDDRIAHDFLENFFEQELLSKTFKGFFDINLPSYINTVKFLCNNKIKIRKINQIKIKELEN
ncbi:hypothetical protein GVAV_002237 [Gurleya vavrai]